MSETKVTVKQWIGVTFIGVILLCTLLAVAGVWGLIQDDVAWRIFYTLVICAVGLGVAGGMLDTFFKDGETLRELKEMLPTEKKTGQ